MIPEDNGIENFVVACSASHLEYHRGRKGNTTKDEIVTTDLSNCKFIILNRLNNHYYLIIKSKYLTKISNDYFQPN